MDDTAPPSSGEKPDSEPRKQHLISKVLLRRFARSGSAGQVGSFDLLHGMLYLRHPTRVGWRWDFVEHQATEMEELWQETETHLAAALDAVEAGTVLDLPAETATLRRAIALHFMRRDQVKDSFGTSLDKARVGITAPPDFHGDPAAFRTAVRARLDDERAATFTENLRALFDKAESLASRSQLEVVHSEAPLLVGDTAVVSIRRDGGVGFIPFSDAATHVLPVGRHHLVALAKESRMLELSEAWAHRLNEQQILNARERVFFHPDDPLESFVREVRDRHQASQSKDVPRPPT